MALSIFEDCVTLPGRGSLVAATAAAIGVLLPATASYREDADGGIGSGPCAIGDPESDELQADRTRGRAIAAANDAAPVRRMNMARPPCFDGAAQSLARLPMRVAPESKRKPSRALRRFPEHESTISEAPCIHGEWIPASAEPALAKAGE